MEQILWLLMQRIAELWWILGSQKCEIAPSNLHRLMSSSLQHCADPKRTTNINVVIGFSGDAWPWMTYPTTSDCARANVLVARTTCFWCQEWIESYSIACIMDTWRSDQNIKWKPPSNCPVVTAGPCNYQFGSVTKNVDVVCWRWCCWVWVHLVMEFSMFFSFAFQKYLERHHFGQSGV